MFKTNSNKKNKLYVASAKPFYNNSVIIKPKEDIKEEIKEEIKANIEEENEIINSLLSSPSVKDLINDIERKEQEHKEHQIDMNNVPVSVKQTLNKLLFVSRYKKL